METYARLPVAFERGEGAYLYDDQGRQYLDALSGLAVCGLGHAHSGVQQAIAEQAGKLLHTSNIYQIPIQATLAAELCRLSGMDKAFFGNSGAEANEAAIKLARLYGHNQGIATPVIVVAEDAFHGRTMATLTATGNTKLQAGFGPMLEGFCRVPYNDLQAIERLADRSDIVAVLMEPVQGEGGVVVPDNDYLPGIRTLCHDQGWLMMLDEVQTGNGRTGHFFAYQGSINAKPDVVTTAKGLGNGVPIGVCLAHGDAANTLSAGTHGSTFGGNPLACAAALAVLQALTQEGLIDRAAQAGELIMQRLQSQLKGSNRVKDIRGSGLMIGIELASPLVDLVNQALKQGLLLNVTQGKVIRILPPLIISDEQAEQIVDTIVALIATEGS